MNSHKVCGKARAYAMRCAIHWTITTSRGLHSGVLDEYLKNYAFTVDRSDVQFWLQTLEEAEFLSSESFDDPCLQYFTNLVRSCIVNLRGDVVRGRGLSRYEILRGSG